jgi:hypothetical protein
MMETSAFLNCMAPIMLAHEKGTLFLLNAREKTLITIVALLSKNIIALRNNSMMVVGSM